MNPITRPGSINDPHIDDLNPETAAAIIVGETEEKIRDVENRLYPEEERREVLDDE